MELRSDEKGGEEYPRRPLIANHPETSERDVWDGK